MLECENCHERYDRPTHNPGYECQNCGYRWSVAFSRRPETCAECLGLGVLVVAHACIACECAVPLLDVPEDLTVGAKIRSQLNIRSERQRLQNRLEQEN